MIHLLRFFWVVFFLFTLHISTSAQQQFIIGNVTDETGRAIENVNIKIDRTAYGAASNKLGKYIIQSRYVKTGELVFSKVGFRSKRVPIQFKSTRDTLRVNTTLTVDYKQIEEVIVKGRVKEEAGLIPLEPKHIKRLPTITGGVEGILKTIPGVYSNNELSSQYSVRGGNFDENLIYINGIEVYRPFLIRTGEQEGLSIVNPDMVQSVYFSAGGFNPEYGDKLSSVLDITYKKPEKFAGSASVSLLGASAHLESQMFNGKVSQISGFRYRNSTYVLNSLETTGEYRPVYADFQTFWTYKVTPKFEINSLTTFSQNRYNFIPEDRSTSFGTRAQALRLYIDFEGQEKDKYTTFMEGLQFNYSPSRKLKLSLTASAYLSQEEETFDIAGDYFLRSVDSQEMNGEKVDNVLSNLGRGAFIDHGRNYLQARFMNIAHRGKSIQEKCTWEWGVKAQYEQIKDDIHEWEMIDSVGYSLGRPSTASEVNLYNTVISTIDLESTRLTAFLQNRQEFELGNVGIDLTSGIRVNYWDYTNQYLISPRINMKFSHESLSNWKFRLATGRYYQPALYRELRKFDGQLVKEQEAQQSIHLVGGAEYQFQLWGRPFVFTSELYYKHLNNMIPYEIDNLRIRYFADQRSVGYTTGLDMKINGEFVKGVDSWLSMSLMKSYEDIDGDNVGYIARPTDQIFQVAAFFQDYFPNNDTWKIHLAGHYATGLPYGAPGMGRENAIFRLPPYRRVDIGISKNLNAKPGEKLLKVFKSIWLSAEVFNLLGINNTVSVLWVRTIPDTSNAVEATQKISEQYAVPNRLTGRRLNFKLTARF